MGPKQTRLLIIRPGALGDTLMLLPTLCQLRGGVSVTVVGRRPGIDFLHDHADRVHDMDGAVWSGLFIKHPDPRGLPVSQHDLALVFLRDEDGTLRRNLKAYLPGAEIHLHPSLPGPGEKTHAARHILERARWAGLPVDPDAGMRLALEGGLFASRPTSMTEGKHLVLHPGSGSPEKNLPPPFWRDLLVALSRAMAADGARPVVLLGPAEEALRPLFSDPPCPVPYEICWCPGKDELIALLRAASLYIGHDSGTTHLAAMLGVPTIALFRASDPIVWRPLGPRVVVIEERDLSHDPIRAILQTAATLAPQRG